MDNAKCDCLQRLLTELESWPASVPMTAGKLADALRAAAPASPPSPPGTAGTIAWAEWPETAHKETAYAPPSQPETGRPFVMPVTFNTLAGWLRGRTDGFGHHASGDIDAACELDAADRAVRAHIATLTAELSDAHLFHAEQRKIFKGLEDRLAERDARIATIEAAASDATEYVLAQINAQLRTDNDSLRQRLAAAEAWQKWGEKYGRLAYVALVNLPYGQWDYALRDMPAGAK